MQFTFDIAMGKMFCQSFCSPSLILKERYQAGFMTMAHLECGFYLCARFVFLYFSYFSNELELGA